MNRELEILAERVTQSLVGVFGHTDDIDGQRVARVGSGIFVAPFQVLTARHVCRDLFRTDPNQFDDLNRRREGYFYLPHSSGLFQVVSSRDQRSIIWSATRSWDPGYTDVCFLEAALDKEASSEKQIEFPTRFLEWSLEPPKPGEEVAMLGFPGTRVEITGQHWNLKCSCVLQVGHVAEVFDRGRDAGMFSFPCFSIDQPVGAGFSGGSVIWQGRLCGIVSGSSIDDRTYAASLWPMCLMDYEYPDLGTLGTTRSFGDLFERGVLRAKDWPLVRERISKHRDDGGKLIPEIQQTLTGVCSRRRPVRS